MQAIFNWRTSYGASAATPVRANSSDLSLPDWGKADLHRVTTVDDLEFVNRAEVQVPAGESAYQYPDILAQYTSKQLNTWPALHRDVPSILKHEHIPELQFTDCRLPDGCLPQLLQERAYNEAMRVSILSSTRKEPMRWVERDALMPCDCISRWTSVEKHAKCAVAIFKYQVRRVICINPLFSTPAIRRVVCLQQSGLGNEPLRTRSSHCCTFRANHCCCCWTQRVRRTSNLKWACKAQFVT